MFPVLKLPKNPGQTFKRYTPNVNLMLFPAVTSVLLIITCLCVICIYLSYIFCLSFCLSVHYHVVISDKEEIKSIYTVNKKISELQLHGITLENVIRLQSITITILITTILVCCSRDRRLNVNASKKTVQ